MILVEKSTEKVLLAGFENPLNENEICYFIENPPVRYLKTLVILYSDVNPVEEIDLNEDWYYNPESGFYQNIPEPTYEETVIQNYREKLAEEVAGNGYNS